MQSSLDGCRCLTSRTANGSRFGGTALWDTLYRICRDSHSYATRFPAMKFLPTPFFSLLTASTTSAMRFLKMSSMNAHSVRQPSIPSSTTSSAHFDADGQKALRSIADLTGGRYSTSRPASSLAQSIQQINRPARPLHARLKPSKFQSGRQLPHPSSLSVLTAPFISASATFARYDSRPICAACFKHT